MADDCAAIVVPKARLSMISHFVTFHSTSIASPCLFLELPPLVPIANTQQHDNHAYPNDRPSDSREHVGRIGPIIIVTVLVLSQSIGVPLRTISIIIAASTLTVLILAVGIIAHYYLLSIPSSIHRSFLLAVFLLLFLLLAEHVLLEDLP